MCGTGEFGSAIPLQLVPVDLERLIAGEAVRPALDPEMQVGRGRVPAVSDQADSLAHLHVLATSHAHQPRPHVRIARLATPADPQDHTVAGKVVRRSQPGILRVRRYVSMLSTALTTVPLATAWSGAPKAG
jgi:hypothetical protein